MTVRANTSEAARHLQESADGVISEMEKVHGPIWGARESLARLLISLASAVLVGSVAFADSILASESAWSQRALLISWVFFFLSITAGVLSVWHAGTLTQARARFVNSEPAFKEEAEQLAAASAEELLRGVFAIVKRYSDGVFESIGQADAKTERYTRCSIWAFILGLALFVLCGALQII
jgi:hypothetical protein